MEKQDIFYTVNEIAKRLNHLEVKNVLSEKDILIKLDQVLEASKDGDEDLFGLWNSLRADLIRFEVDKAEDQGIDCIKSGDVYLPADVDDVDERGLYYISKVYEKVYS